MPTTATKLSNAARTEILEMFTKDLETINTTVTQQLASAWDATKRALEKEHNVVDNRGKIAKIEQEQEDAEAAFLEAQSAYHTKRRLREERVEELKKASLGALAKNPDGKLLMSLGVKVDHYSERKWHGFKISNQMDALICARLKSTVNIMAAVEAIETVRTAVMRELRLSATLEEAKSIYERFRALRFENFGVKLPPRLADVAKSKIFREMSGRQKPAKQLKAASVSA